jgi:hypothetical protein
MTTKKSRGTVRRGDFYPGRLAVIQVNGFVNSSSRNQSEIRQTDVVKEEFNV